MYKDIIRIFWKISSKRYVYSPSRIRYILIKVRLNLNYLCCHELTMLKTLLQFGERSPLLRNSRLLRTCFKSKFAVAFSSYKPLLPKSNKGIREVTPQQLIGMIHWYMYSDRMKWSMTERGKHGNANIFISFAVAIYRKAFNN